MSLPIERALPFIAEWGSGLFVGLAAAAIFGVWLLGRGHRFLIPASWPARIASFCLVVCAVVASLAFYATRGPIRPMLDQVRSFTEAVGRPAQDLTFRQVSDDRPRRLKELRGRVVLINLWATWCEPCRRELPAIDRLQRDYEQRGLVVVTVSNEARDHLLGYAKQHPYSTMNVYSSQLGWLEADGRPLSIVIDRAGVVRECIIGSRTYDEFEQLVTKHL